jgi:predicted Zn finger-like uncharacterized protein
MILTCPECGTQYVVKDGAIPPEGRQVRCAACKHSWHQNPEASEAGEPETGLDAPPTGGDAGYGEPADGAPADDESLTEATLIDPSSGPEAEERAYEEAVLEDEVGGPALEAEPDPAASAAGEEAPRAVEDVVAAAPPAEDWREPPHAEAGSDMFSPFAENGEVEPPRRSPLTVIAIVALLIVAAAVLFWLFAPPELKARLGLAAAGASPLALVYTHSDRQKLESGNELLTVSGRVINPTAKEQAVPPLQAQLTNREGKIVYKWTIAPPARSLPAGASASFNSAEVNVPPGGEFLTITTGAPRT